MSEDKAALTVEYIEITSSITQALESWKKLINDPPKEMDDSVDYSSLLTKEEMNEEIQICYKGQEITCKVKDINTVLSNLGIDWKEFYPVATSDLTNDSEQKFTFIYDLWKNEGK